MVISAPHQTVTVTALQGGSESWFTESNVAIASLAFHPTAQLLLIATNNELHFWDWSRPEPFAVVKTGSDTERVRWVKHGRWSEVESERVHDVTVITERAAVFINMSLEVFSSTSSLSVRLVRFDPLGHNLLTAIVNPSNQQVRR